MPFGQIGFMDTGGGGSVGGGWDIFSDVVTAAGSIFGPGGAFGQQPPTQAPFLPSLPAMTPTIGGALGGLAGGAIAELLPSLLGGNGNGSGMVGAPPGIFTTPTGTMKPRAKNKVQFYANGECITYFKATPDRWKINASNIHGRRKHRHPR